MFLSCTFGYLFKNKWFFMQRSREKKWYSIENLFLLSTNSSTFFVLHNGSWRAASLLEATNASSKHVKKVRKICMGMIKSSAEDTWQIWRRRKKYTSFFGKMERHANYAQAQKRRKASYFWITWKTYPKPVSHLLLQT